HPGIRIARDRGVVRGSGLRHAERPATADVPDDTSARVMPASAAIHAPSSAAACAPARAIRFQQRPAFHLRYTSACGRVSLMAANARSTLEFAGGRPHFARDLIVPCRKYPVTAN